MWCWFAQLKLLPLEIKLPSMWCCLVKHPTDLMVQLYMFMFFFFFLMECPLKTSRQVCMFSVVAAHTFHVVYVSVHPAFLGSESINIQSWPARHDGKFHLVVNYLIKHLDRIWYRSSERDKFLSVFKQALSAHIFLSLSLSFFLSFLLSSAFSFFLIPWYNNGKILVRADFKVNRP